MCDDVIQSKFSSLHKSHVTWYISIGDTGAAVRTSQDLTEMKGQ